MEGTTISHYEVLERLGGGGMGVVYRARDTRLNRDVAIKVLPRELTFDDDARRRFSQEAQAASRLDHPNICTIYEIDSTPEGQIFIVMALYEGETLKELAERGPLPVDQAVDVALQAARGLAKAHSAGIVHRDVKPANLILTADGLVKILDFGVAKLRGATDLTQTGATIGTVSYMAPETLKGVSADPPSDVWALGVVLFELLTGRRPFEGESAWAVMAGIAERDPGPPSVLRAEVPEVLDDVVARALEKDPERRLASGSEFEQAVSAVLADPASEPTPTRGVSRRTMIASAAAVLLAFAGTIAWFSLRSAELRWAREEALPEAEALMEATDWSAAYRIALEVEDLLPNDPVLADVLRGAARSGTVVTAPSGVSVSWRPYGSRDDPWEYLGETPIADVRVARGHLEWRLERDGYATRHVAMSLQRLTSEDSPLTLLEEEAVPEGMVLVDDDNGRIVLNGLDFELPVSPFFLDRYETTNREFQDFVDAGAYEDSTFWPVEFVRDGERVGFAEAMEEFVDASGRPGPATWSLGRYRPGQQDLPVQGVSWYEAVAYAHFRGKELPTFYHWARAALSGSPGRVTVAQSNLEGEAPRPVNEGSGLGPYGTYDMTGNVREWTWNEFEGGRMAMGGAWSDPIYLYNQLLGVDPWNRSPANGVRLMRTMHSAQVATELRAPVSLGSPIDRRGAQPLPREQFELLAAAYEYPRDELDASIDSEDTSADLWIRRVVSVRLSYTDERLRIAIFLPKDVDPPYQAVIFSPGIGPYGAGGGPLPGRPPRWVEHVLIDGRAVVVPEWGGAYGRREGNSVLSSGQLTAHLPRWREELGRTVDLLAQDPDFDPQRVGFWGESFGGSTFLPAVALEDRIKVWVLTDGALAALDLPPQADAVNFVSRVTVPVLMLNGELDELFPPVTNQIPLYDLLGTDPARKAYRTQRVAHGALLQERDWLVRESLAWFDQYLGRVQ